MIFPRSIRWRLQLWYGALLIALLCGFGFTAYHLEKVRRFSRIDDELHARLSLLVDSLRASPQRGPDGKPAPRVILTPAQEQLFRGADHYYYAVWMQGTTPIAVSPWAQQPIDKPTKTTGESRTVGDRREVFLFAAPVDCVLVGRSIAGEQTDLHKFGAALVSVGAVVLAVGLIGGWWLISLSLRPIKGISEAASEMAAGDFSRRIEVPETESELARLAITLNTTFAQLEALFAQQAHFTADAAHELRTPVAVLLTQTQSALARERPAAEYRETLEACQRAAQRMRGLIESLLELARLDAGQEPLRSAPCDLSKIAGECLELVRPLAEARKIRIEKNLRGAPCEGDAGRLAQVITNLLGNAVTYNREGGEIRLETAAGEREATLTVTDSGVGIAAEDLPHVFERFYRGDKARASGNSGLGLSIAEAIVRAHRGSIEVASHVGVGTRFTLRLPKAEAEVGVATRRDA